MNGIIEFEIIDNISDLYNLKKSWMELYSKLENQEIFYNWIWIETYIKEIKKEKLNPFVVVGKDKGEVIIIAPLCIEYKGYGIFRKNILKFIVDSVADYKCILIKKDYNQYSILKRLFEKIIDDKRIDIIRLNNISDRERQGNLINEVAKIFKDKIVCYKKINGIAPYIKFDEYMYKRNKKRYKEAIRKEKRADNNKLINININSNWDRDIWYKLIDIHKNTWNDSILKNKDYVKFYESLFRKLFESGNLEFSYATYDNEVIAGHIGFKCNDKIYGYNLYNNNIGKDFSMGDILINKIIQYYNQEYKVLDMLLGNEQYKFYLTDSAVNISNYTIIKKKNYFFRILMRLKQIFG